MDKEILDILDKKGIKHYKGPTENHIWIHEKDIKNVPDILNPCKFPDYPDSLVEE